MKQSYGDRVDPENARVLELLCGFMKAEADHDNAAAALDRLLFGEPEEALTEARVDPPAADPETGSVSVTARHGLFWLMDPGETRMFGALLLNASRLEARAVDEDTVSVTVTVPGVLKT